MRGKKGVSIIIGYVILIAVAITMSFLVYAWMKSYVPKEELKCPEDVSIRIVTAECGGGVIDLEIKNTGLFDINGYIVKGKNKDGVLIDLSNGYFIFDSSLKLAPGDEPRRDLFGSDGSQTIDLVEVTPLRTQEKEETEEGFDIVVCGEAIVSKSVGPCYEI